MDLGLTGCSVLITGASKGIGRATALAFAREGAAAIHVTARSGAELESLKAEIEAGSPAKVHPHALDLTNAAAREKLIAATLDVDILINNAGAIPSGSIYAVDEKAWRDGWELKVFGYIAMTRAFYAHMCERGHGVILNDIGNSGENPDFNYVAGSAGNASLMAFTKAMGGRSLDHGVRVLAVNPGPVATERMDKMLRQRAQTDFGDAERWPDLLRGFPAKRAASSEEVADLMVFLSSPRAAYMSGCIVTIDGGISARGSIV